jgi:dTDP-4-amino-4,6-dideoxygalactose transaminase
MPASEPWLRLGETVFPKHIALRRLSRMHGALLKHWRRQLAEANRRRADLATELARRGGLDLPCGPGHPYLRMPVYATNPADRTRRLADAHDRGLGFSRAYPGPVSEIPEVESIIGPQQFPNALHAATHLMTVPTHQWVRPRDVDAIVSCLGQGIRSEVPSVSYG